MDFILNHLEKCAKFKLDVFEVNLMQNSIKESLYCEVILISAVTESAPLGTLLVGNGQDYTGTTLCCTFAARLVKLMGPT